jgi:adenine phosphoribosyltransferase
MNFKDALKLTREIPDFPKSGILFLDITPVLSNASAFAAVVTEMEKSAAGTEVIAGIEARGFILAAALAARTSKGFVPFRKQGKLPHKTHGAKYGLEYGDDELELHVDAFSTGQHVLIVDDVLATGGTLIAAIELALLCGAIVEKVLVLFEIDFLEGRKRIEAVYPNIEIIALAHA